MYCCMNWLVSFVKMQMPTEFQFTPFLVLLPVGEMSVKKSRLEKVPEIQLMSSQWREKKRKKALYLSFTVLRKKLLIEDTIFTSPSR